MKKIQIKESGQPEGPFVPILINHLSTPVLTMNTTEPKFNFPSNRIQYSEESSQLNVFTPQCYCCPITGACRNSENGVEVKKDECEASSQLNGLFQKQIGAQEDSGIETSDSCDEKKKKSCHRTVKHQHSKLSSTGCSTVKESVWFLKRLFCYIFIKWNLILNVFLNYIVLKEVVKIFLNYCNCYYSAIFLLKFLPICIVSYRLICMSKIFQNDLKFQVFKKLFIEFNVLIYR